MFAALGHQESWSQISAIVGGLRAPLEPLTQAQLRELVPWIPPRTVSRLRIAAVPGIYVDTFITPDELRVGATRRVLGKVREGIAAAQREGAKVVALGGFTSIFAESITMDRDCGIAVTTGNTLTAALIVQGLERAAMLLGRRLEEEVVLVIGATGDVGSACARSLNGRVRRLLLAARNASRLEREANALCQDGPVEASTDVPAMLGKASMVIAAASVPEPAFDLGACRSDAIVCDAGYPKNIRITPGTGPRVFWGGMGCVEGGMTSNDGFLETFYRFPVRDVAHGCLLEGVVLAMAGRFEDFSVGRGRISPARVQEMWRLACDHGVSLAPLFDSTGVWPEDAT